MAARSRSFPVLKNSAGQSVLEFVLLLPVLIGFPFMFYKVNAAIQTSIVNQKYARSQALFLAGNSSKYPRWFSFRIQGGAFMGPKTDEMILGVASNLGNREGFFEYVEAPVQTIVRPGQPDGNDDAQTLPTLRGKIRIRTTVSLCTQNNFILTGGGAQYFHSASLNESYRPTYCKRDEANE